MTSRFLRSSMFRPLTTASLGRSVNWNRLLFRYPDAKDRDRIAAMQTRFSEVNAKWGSVPKTLGAVDFAKWRSVIKTPGVVDSMEAKYNDAIGKQQKFDSAGQAVKDATNENEIRGVADKAKASNQFLEELELELQWLREQHDIAEATLLGPRYGWNDWALKYLHPHANIYRVNEFFFLEYPLRDKGHFGHPIMTADWSAIRSQVKDGNVKALAFMEPIMARYGDLGWLRRPFFKKWIKKQDFAAIAKDPNQSIFYRAWALKKLN